MHQLLKAENSLFQSQLDDMKALLKDSQATIKNQEITINSLKTEKEVGQIKCFVPMMCALEPVNLKRTPDCAFPEPHTTVKVNVLSFIRVRRS